MSPLVQRYRDLLSELDAAIRNPNRHWGEATRVLRAQADAVWRELTPEERAELERDGSTVTVRSNL